VGGPERFALFRDLDDDLWALLLSGEYESYPNIRAFLPSVPEPSLQELWNGTSGLPLAAQSLAFYRKLRERHAAYAGRPLSDSPVLDFGCGWGRLTRYLARDVSPGHLFGCDPVEQILDVCRDGRVPATLAKSEFVPERLPFETQFDLAFSFSVFTHISERAHESCLRALHNSLRPGGLLVMTVRPPAYLRFSPLMGPALDALGPDPDARLVEPLYVFVPHPAEDSHLQYEGGEMTYGETVVTLAYVRERWAPLFHLLEVDLLVDDPYQLMLTLRRP
jgi:SAM-dependent methyltransferase